MSLRLRLILATAVAVAVAVVLCAFGSYLTTRHELRHQVDVALARRVELPRLRPFVRSVPFTPPVSDRQTGRLSNDASTLQVINSAGQILAGNGRPLPVSAADRAMAAGGTGVKFRDATVDGLHLRLATTRFATGTAIEAAQPLDAVDGTLHRLVLLLALLALGGIAVAAALG